MVENLWEDASTYPSRDSQLWLEAGAIDGSDRNMDYRMPMTSTWEMRSGHIASTLGI